LREQVVAQKVGNRTGLGKPRSSAGQRPAKRASGESIGARLRSLLTYVPTALRIAAIAIVCLLVVIVYRAAAAGLALLAYRTQAAEIRTGINRRGSTGKLTHFVSRFKNRFGSIF
jgi:hypothetical protein